MIAYVLVNFLDNRGSYKPSTHYFLEENMVVDIQVNLGYAQDRSYDLPSYFLQENYVNLNFYHHLSIGLKIG